MYTIRHMGCDSTHGSEFCFCRPRGFETYLALFVKTRALFYLDGRELRTEPGMFIVFDKGSWIKYRCYGESYIDDWIHFDCDEKLAVEFSHPYYFGNRIPVAEYFHLICDVYYRRNELASSHLMNAFFSEITSVAVDTGSKGVHYRELADMRRKIYMSPEYNWSVPEMAQSLHLSPAHLQELYKETFGVSCRADVIASRIEAAKNLLDGTSLSVAEVGYRCGYNSAVHFSRQFSEHTGISPSKWKQRK